MGTLKTTRLLWKGQRATPGDGCYLNVSWEVYGSGSIWRVRLKYWMCFSRWKVGPLGCVVACVSCVVAMAGSASIGALWVGMSVGDKGVTDGQVALLCPFPSSRR